MKDDSKLATAMVYSFVGAIFGVIAIALFLFGTGIVTQETQTIIKEQHQPIAMFTEEWWREWISAFAGIFALIAAIIAAAPVYGQLRELRKERQAMLIGLMPDVIEFCNKYRNFGFAHPSVGSEDDLPDYDAKDNLILMQKAELVRDNLRKAAFKCAPIDREAATQIYQVSLDVDILLRNNERENLGDIKAGMAGLSDKSSPQFFDDISTPQANDLINKMIEFQLQYRRIIDKLGTRRIKL